MAMPDPCPICSGERTAGTCPRCLIRLGLEGPGSDLLDPSEPGVTTQMDRQTSRVGVLETLALTVGPLPRVLLRDTENFNGPGPVVRPGSPEMPGPRERTGRLQLFGEIARGGMGVILKGRDNDLGRDLAVKVLLERHGDDPALLRRFVEEAQIAGQLQHPGVVPIYEMGSFTDQRPYFAMKLVKGRTLAEVMGERANPSSDLTRLLAIFLDVAQTMAYTHARGVIHRDLKPSNIMVGSFGEVQVMDWGLAKVLPRGGVVDDREAGKLNVHETVIATARSGSGSDTGSDLDLSHAGSVLGTPSYMAPEQARGENEHVDERADVFALGSILCEMLTGQPAFAGRNSGEILRMAARGDLAGAWKRLDDCGADPELIAIARDALAPEVEDRPPHAGAIVDQLSGYLAGVQARVQAAERDRAVAQAQAIEERRRRKLQTALAASILALAVLGGLGGTAYFQQRQARAESVARLLGEAETLLARAAERPDEPARWREALAAAGRIYAGHAGDAKGRLEKIKAEAEGGLGDSERDVRLRQALGEIRAARLDIGNVQLDESYTRAFQDAGLDFDALRSAEAVARLKKRPPGVVAELVAFLDHWIEARDRGGRPAAEQAKLREVAIAADDDPFRRQIRTLLASKDRPTRDAELKALADDPRSEDLPAPTALLLAASLRDRPDRIARLRKAVARHPDDVWLNVRLAQELGYQSVPAREEMVRYYAAARACRPEVGTELAEVLAELGRVDEAEAIFLDLIARRPDDMNNFAAYAAFARKQGRNDQARDLDQRAILAGRRTIARRPEDSYLHYLLEMILSNQGRRDEAIAEAREAIRLRPGDAASHNNLGVTLFGQGKIDEAIVEYREAIRLNPDLVVSHYNLGINLSSQGKLDEAIAELREAIRIDTDYSDVHIKLADALDKQGKIDEAIVEYRQGFRRRPDDALVHFSLALRLQKIGRLEQAVDEFRETVRIDGDRMGDAIWDLGDVLLKLDRPQEAIAVYRRARQIGRDNPAYVVKADLKIESVHQRDAEIQCNTATELWKQGKKAEAIAAFREVVRLRPSSSYFRDWLGYTLLMTGKTDEAIVELREAIQLQPDFAQAHHNLAVALKRKGKSDEAIAEWRETFRLDVNHMAALSALLAELLKRDVEEAIVEWRALRRLKPDNPFAINNLIDSSRAQGRMDIAFEALGDFRDLVRRHPSDAIAHYRFAISLRDLDKFDEAVDEFREAVRIDGTKGGEATWHLGDLLILLGRPDEALDLYLRAREIGRDDPAQVAKAEAGIASVDRARALAARFPAIAKGEDRPRDRATFLQIQRMMYAQRRFVLAARFSAEAFADEPKLADDMARRYSAACSALLAAEGRDRDEPNPDEAARTRLRHQALDWSKVVLAFWEAKPPAGLNVNGFFNHWKTDIDMNGVRSPEALARLPEAERREWQTFWAEVDRVEAKARKIDVADRHRSLKQHAAATGLYADRLAAEPELAGIKGVAYRYRAALSAAQAGSGLGDDDPKPDEPARTQLRRQALTWLKINLDLRKEQMTSEGEKGLEAIKTAGLLWKGAPDLACVRDEAELAKLPEAERKEWQAFWTEIDDLLARANQKAGKP